MADWKTISVLSVGRDNTVYDNTDQSAVPQSTKYWSSSPNCDTGLTEFYNDNTAKYYCGYYALISPTLRHLCQLCCSQVGQ